MRTISFATAFKRDRKRVAKTPHHSDLDSILIFALELLVADKPLPAELLDHSLSGKWARYRDCHLKNDLVLIYRSFDNERHLARLGSHSELFGK